MLPFFPSTVLWDGSSLKPRQSSSEVGESLKFLGWKSKQPQYAVYNCSENRTSYYGTLEHSVTFNKSLLIISHLSLLLLRARASQGNLRVKTLAGCGRKAHVKVNMKEKLSKCEFTGENDFFESDFFFPWIYRWLLSILSVKSPLLWFEEVKL